METSVSPLPGTCSPGSSLFSRCGQFGDCDLCPLATVPFRDLSVLSAKSHLQTGVPAFLPRHLSPQTAAAGFCLHHFTRTAAKPIDNPRAAKLKKHFSVLPVCDSDASHGTAARSPSSFCVPGFGRGTPSAPIARGPSFSVSSAASFARLPLGV